MHFNLQVLNLLFSLCDHSSETPELFRDLGYSVAVVEPRIELVKLKRVVNPECLVSSAKAGNSLVVEVKSGTATEAEQREQYEKLSRGDLLGGGLGIDKAALKTFDVVLIVHAEFLTRHVEHLDEVKSPLVLVSYNPLDGTFRLHRGQLENARLNTVLRRGLQIPWPPAPHDFVTFDGNSSDIEIAQAIVPSLIRMAMARRQTFNCNEICHEANRCWNVLDSEHRKALTSRITRVVEALVVVGFHGIFRIVARKPKAPFEVEVSAQAHRAAMRDPNQFARRLLAAQEEALGEMQRKLEEEKRDKQRPLFGEDTVLPPINAPRRSRRRK